MVRAVLSTSLLPKPAPGIALAFDPAFSHRFRAVFGAMYLPPQRTADGVAGISLTTLHAGTCGGTTGTLTVGVDLCVALHAGATHAAVHRLEPDRPGDRLWLGAAFGLRFRVRIAEALILDASVDGMVPLTRHRFRVTPAAEDQEMFAQTFGLLAGVGLGWNLF